MPEKGWRQAWRSVAVALAAVLLAGVAPEPAPAQDSTATETDPAAAAAARGMALYEQENYGGALEEFETALAAGQQGGRLLYKTAFCQQATGKPVELVRQTMSRAIVELDKVVNDGEGQAELLDHYFLSAAFGTIGSPQVSRTVASHALDLYRGGQFGSIDSFSGDDLFRLARLAGDAGDQALRLEAFSRAAETLEAQENPNKQYLARSLSEVGMLHLQAGRMEEALPAIKQVMEVMPSYPGARNAYALLLFRQGHFAEAGEQWQQVRIEDPAREAEAGYAVQLMKTLQMHQLLLPEAGPLEDLTAVNGTDLESKMITLATQMSGVAAQLPEKVVARGYAVYRDSDMVRDGLREYRDLKYRLAWVAAEYTARGVSIREFAFRNGLQSSLRPWNRLPRASDNLPDSALFPAWVDDAERARHEARLKSRKEAAQREGSMTDEERAAEEERRRKFNAGQRDRWKKQQAERQWQEDAAKKADDDS